MSLCCAARFMERKDVRGLDYLVGIVLFDGLVASGGDDEHLTSFTFNSAADHARVKLWQVQSVVRNLEDKGILKRLPNSGDGFSEPLLFEVHP